MQDRYGTDMRMENAKELRKHSRDRRKAIASLKNITRRWSRFNHPEGLSESATELALLLADAFAKPLSEWECLDPLGWKFRLHSAPIEIAYWHQRSSLTSVDGEESRSPFSYLDGEGVISAQMKIGGLPRDLTINSVHLLYDINQATALYCCRHESEMFRGSGNELLKRICRAMVYQKLCLERSEQIFSKALSRSLIERGEKMRTDQVLHNANKERWARQAIEENLRENERVSAIKSMRRRIE